MIASHAKKIMGNNLIGPEELNAIRDRFAVSLPSAIPPLPYDAELLAERRNDSLLVFGPDCDAEGTPLTLVRLRERFGTDPDKSEPCFYNQDWYLREPFARDATLENRWYLIRKQVLQNSRGAPPEQAKRALQPGEQLPSALLTAFAFFSYYVLTQGEILWEHDFLWCADQDSNGDQIYTGRYHDPKGMNKPGFNIHRHLSIHSSFGVAPQV